MVWILGIAGLALLAFFGVRFLDRPIVRRRPIAEIADMVAMLQGCLPGSVLRLRHLGSDRFLQMVQRSEVLGVDDLLFGFPDAPWSRDSFLELERRLEANGTPFSVRETGRDDTRRFLEVTIQGNDDSVNRRAVEILNVAARSMGLAPDAVFKVHVDGASDHARWAWGRRKHLSEQKRMGGLQGRAAGWSLAQMDGRLVDPNADEGDKATN